MSHEIRTPINTVLGMNEMILRQSEDKEISGYARHIKGAGKMLVGLIDEILDFSKIEAGKLEIASVEYSLPALLTDAQTAVASRVEEKGLTLLLQTQKELPAVLKGDELRMKQILNNLLSNAVKYTESGSVTLGTAGEVCGENRIMLRLWVEDTGMGIKKEDIPHLFDSFQRLELEKNRHIQGTGLGLCITKQLVDAMGGTIEVSGEYGEGTRFDVCIPQEIISWEEAEQVGASVNEEKAEQFCAPEAEILAVDDNRVNLAVLKGLLKRTQVHLDLAMSGTQALERTREKKYDLILMDHMMPEMDGIETLAALRKEKENPNRETKVIALTANAIQGAEEEYRKEGFDDYLSKPVDPDKLEELLRKHLG
jgi:CheY-like chemotaxis protein/anti-sigma regulatory factor (Ser/Thr protein kinase)